TGKAPLSSGLTLEPPGPPSQPVYLLQRTQNLRIITELLEAPRGPACPVRAFRAGPGHVLGLALVPQVLQVDQHAPGRPGHEVSLAGPHHIVPPRLPLRLEPP